MDPAKDAPEAAQAPPARKDSCPPAIPSSAAGERPSLQPSVRSAPALPRTSLRPANFLTGYDLPLDRESLKLGVANHVEYTQGKDEYSTTPLDFYCAAARTTRDRLLDRWNKTQQSYYREDKRRVYYLSLEFLLGRLFEDSLLNLGIYAPMEQALSSLGLQLSELAQVEPDAGLGNGGLGRLAACFLDSMATLGVPATGYGIRYEYGIFEQQLLEGRQVERADNWLRNGNPWEIPRPEQRYLVRFGGRVEQAHAPAGRRVFRWVDTEDVWAMAYDTLIPGYGNDVVNTLRLWSAQATRAFQFSYFNDGDYVGAVQQKNATENISRVLYPNDSLAEGRELRLKQEYFFVAATLQDAVSRHLKTHTSLESLPDKAVFQLNDTHPGLAVAELMRLLVDERGFQWDDAWRLTTRCFAYTNHTVLPEALETWPVSLLERVLPRHLGIIYELNQRFLDEVLVRFPGDIERMRRMSLIEEFPEKRVRMAHLCVLGSSRVNGVSGLHGKILRERLFRDFAELYPDRFTHVTNGITPRRWLLKCNPPLSELITSRLGERWVTDLGELARLRPLAEDAEFRAQWRASKLANKRRLATALERAYGLRLDPESLLDVQIKRVHEYKRQLLNILHVAGLYLRHRRHPPNGLAPRTFLFAGKAAPGYRKAKQLIELICAVGRVLERDPATRDLLRVVYVPNYGVSLAELIIPAADLSEQISTAGTEASGTGNMKLALNGALTIGTLDGANIELREAVGKDAFFDFGLSAAAVESAKFAGYRPRQLYASDPDLRAVLDAVAGGVFSPEDPGRFFGLVEDLLREDPFLVLADHESYRSCHEAVLTAWADQETWIRKSILNTAAMGQFSSDNVIRNYAQQIWGVTV